MSIAHLLAVLALAHAACAAAATTTTVLDVPTPGGMQRILHLRPDAPRANLVVLSGGRLGIQSDGSMTTDAALCDPAVRNRQALADHGYAVVLVDVPLSSLTWYADSIEVLRYLQGRELLPTWVVAGSNATGSAVRQVRYLALGKGLGAVFYSPEVYDPLDAAAIAHPSLVVYHVDDARQRGSELFRALIAASAKQEARLAGGNNAGCDGYHTLNGLDVQFVAAVTAFIDAQNPRLVATPLADTATAVEFYYASFDHYFVTSLDAEIASLDAGRIAGWVRTGESFTAWSESLFGRQSVLRFFSTAFAPRSSHFYASLPSELARTFDNSDWQLEGSMFSIEPPDSHGSCRSGTVPLYRLYNNAKSGAPNHRYTTNADVRSRMLSEGWTSEGYGPLGVIACVLP